MPIKESAKKALRQAKKHHELNLARSKAAKDVVKKIKKLALTNKDEAKKLMATAYQAIDKAARRGVIKRNTAARRKSRLMKLLNK